MRLQRRRMMTREQAIEMAESGWWKTATNQEIVAFQLFEKLLCMDFGRFHEATEAVLGRPVYTHEFAFVEELRKEYLTQRPPMTIQESLGMLQARFPHSQIIPIVVE